MRIMDVEMEKYNYIELFRDAKARANELRNLRTTSGVEDLTNSQANIQFHCEPIVPLVKPMTRRLVIKSVSNSISPPQLKSTSQQKSSKSPAKPTSTSPPKLTAKASPPVQLKRKSYPSPSPYIKPDCRKPSDEHVQTAPLLQFTHNPCKPDSNPKYSSKTLTKPNSNLGEPTAAPTKPHTSNSTSKCPPPFNPLPLVALGVDELLDFVVGSLCREPEWKVEENEWDDGRETEISIIGAHIEGGRVIVSCVNDNPASNDDSQDENFVEDGENIEDVNDSEDVSLDKETNSSDYGDDDQWKLRLPKGC
ncbi:hypothetical protein Cgig2_018755 [Carnegiea gigantea]|uniref:Uncharacterized protein n=1 Tax=Carnegiea gigantea TaxID=171969 RepID=A0A9Q1JKX6_9CARY|nr:hypothetical protein Cgig2_018755 [Carnegiea gigantea]